MKNVKTYFRKPAFLVVFLIFSMNVFSQSKGEMNMPLPSELFAKHVVAIGGEKVIKKYTKRTLIGKLLINAYGIKGALHIIAEAPNKMVTKIDLGQFGYNRSGFNGEIGWSMDPQSGNKVLKGEALQVLKEKSNFFANSLDLGKNATKTKTVELITDNNDEQYRVYIQNSKGEDSYIYFSKKTGLLTGIDSMELTPMGKVPTKVRLSNYVDLEGIKTARKISSTQNGVETIIEIDSISYDDHESDAFDLPAEIKALIKD